MKDYNPDALRNITFVGHGGSGKTTLSEVILYTGNEINRIGRIEEGNTVSDYNNNEIERQISIASTALHLEWNNSKINMLDTPGYSDFTGQVLSGLHIVDAACAVVKSAEGVEVGTEATWDLVKRYKLPSSVIINKVDNEHSKFFETVEAVKEKLSSDATVVTFPVAEGVNFVTVVDLTKMKAYTYGEAGSRKVTEVDIPDSVKEQADELRQQLIEKVAESDEELMNKFFEEGTLTEDELTKGLKTSMLNNSFVPVFATSASKVVGINNFLDFVTRYFPSPADRTPVEASMKDKDAKIQIKCDQNGEPSFLIFKSLSEQHVGEISIFKVFSGTLTAGMDLINTKRDKTERLGQLFVINGKTRKDVAKLSAGDIGGVG